MNKQMNNTLEGINSRITDAKEWINHPEDRVVEITTAEQNKEKRMNKKMKTAYETFGTTLNINIHIISTPEGEEREKGSEKISEEIIAENFPKMGKKIVNKVQ